MPPVSNYSIEVIEDRISVHSPFSYKDRLKAINGSKWDNDIKAWTFPFASAEQIDNIVSKFIVPRTQGFIELLSSLKEERKSSEEVRISIALPDPEITKMPSWNHQRQAYHFAKNKNSACLAMDMGTGKTKVAIDILQNNDVDRVLIVCPSHVIAVWPKEFEKHCVDFNNWEIVTLNTGSTPKNVMQLKNTIDITRARKKKLVVIVNYEAVWRVDLAKVIMSVFWDYVIADESHRIKSATGVASKFMAKLKIVSKKRLALTGTPMPHTPMDIFAQYRFLNDQIFGTSYTRFKRRYGKWGGFGGYQLLGFENEDELNSKFYSIAYKVGKEVLDLPEVMPPINVPVILEPDARKKYNSMMNDFLVWLNEDDAVTATNSLSKLLRLQQITSGFIPVPETEEVAEISSAKERALREILIDLEQLEPVVIFCRFRRDLDTIHAVAKSLDRKSAELSGRMSSLDLWQRSENLPILAVQIQAGGVGIDLTRARYCIYYSLGFSLGDYEQSLARVHRPGQKRPVQYIHLIAKNTVDETVYKALENKKEVVTEILREVRTGYVIHEEFDFDQGEFNEPYGSESDNED